MQMQMQARPDPYQEPVYEDDDGGSTPMAGAPTGDDYGNQVDPNQLILQAITAQAARQAAQVVNKGQKIEKNFEDGVKRRMERLVKDFPSLAEEGSELVNRARTIYSRIAVENPGIDEPTKYELAVREAASVIGARPVTLPAEDPSWTMPSGGTNPALPSKSSRSRLTPEIVTFAKVMGIDVDPRSKLGQQNLKELSENSARFNADQDESAFKYR